jgi:glutamine synthetase
MNLEDLRSRVDAGEIDTVLLALCDMQGRLQGKRLTARHFVEEVAEHGAEGCNYLLAVDVDMNTVEGYAMSSWERGYGDFVLRPDMSTLRPVPWQEGTAMVLCDIVWEDGSDVVASPRQILRRQLDRLAQRGWTANSGTELEFMLFRETYESAWHKAYRDLDPGNLYNVDYSFLGTARVEPLIRRIRNSMEAAGMAVENSKGECNYGQHEINFRYAEAMRGDAHRRRPRDLQERGQGDRRSGRHGDQLHGQVQRTRGQLVSHPLLARRKRWGWGGVRPGPGAV